MNLSEAIETATRRLQTVSDSPQLDAGLLLCHVLDCPRSYLLSHPEARLERDAQQSFEALLARREQGEPVAYLTGTKSFWSLELKVTPAVLVPRPETETLVEAALDRMPPDQPMRVADLGTGCGAVALSLARERPQVHVVATDCSDPALAVARDNERQLGIPNVAFYESAWFRELAGQRFDLIVSNPPYVAEGDPHLASLRHEPQAALQAGADGLDAIRQIIRDAPGFLNPGGWLMLEHGADQAESVRSLLAEAGFVHVETRTDLAGRPRVSLGQANPGQHG